MGWGLTLQKELLKVTHELEETRKVSRVTCGV